MSASRDRGTPAFVNRVLRRLEGATGKVVVPPLEDPVVCLIGTILSQATNDPLAERAYTALRRRFRSWRAVLEATPAAVEREIGVSGLGAQKTRAIQAFLRHLVATRGRITLQDLRLPDIDVDAALAELTSIPGIGIKTAAITLMFSAGVSLCAVDTHLVRVLRRLAIVPPLAAPDRAFRLLRPLVPRGRGIDLHLQLIRHGRKTCRSRPLCPACPLLDLCEYGQREAAPGGAAARRIHGPTEPDGRGASSRRSDDGVGRYQRPRSDARMRRGSAVRRPRLVNSSG